MSRIATCRASLVRTIANVVPDRAFESAADAGDNLPAVYVDDLSITENLTPNVVVIVGTILAVVDGTDAAQVHQLDEVVDALWDQLFVDQWKPSNAISQTLLRQIVGGDTPPDTETHKAYRITVRRQASLPDNEALPDPTPEPDPEP